jgi:hypothetical protein
MPGMADSFTSSTSNSWGSRIVSSLTGVIVGILFIPGSILLLSWNEANSVATARSLAEGAKTVIDISAEKMDPANDGKLVHVTGDAVTTAGVSDPIFEISAVALTLHRNVEMYQWKETESSEEKKNLGGSTETVTTYKYEKDWSGGVIDSSKFKHPQDHANPESMIADSCTFTAGDVTLGAFKLPKLLVEEMSGEEPITPTAEDFAKLPESLKSKAQLTASGLYFGKDPAAAAIGDQRVSFEVLKPGVFSILARQSGGTFEPYSTKAGKEIERVEPGTVSAAAMFQHAQSENAIITWVLRLVGFVLMFIGFGMIFKPLSVLGDVVPFIGSIIGAGTGLAALLLALGGTFLTIAIAWLAVRPLFGGTLIVVAVALLIWIYRIGAARRKAS